MVNKQVILKLKQLWDKNNLSNIDKNGLFSELYKVIDSNVQQEQKNQLKVLVFGDHMQEDMESIMEKLKEKDKFILVLLVHFLKNTEDKNKAKQL